MRRGKTGLLLAALSAVLALALAPVAARAESLAGADNWQVTFTSGKAMESNFDSKVFADEISQVQPGDDITLKVALKNEYPETTDWYMADETVQAFEDAGAKGGAYTYKLTYTGPDGASRTLYDSTTVGGDDSSGLKDVNSALENYLYLGSIETGKSGEVTVAESSTLRLSSRAS